MSLVKRRELKMAAKTMLNAKNLEGLGVTRLAELLIEISTGSAAAKRRLRLELAGNSGSSEVAHEVRKRLASIARSKTSINWRRVKAVRTDLDTQRKTITDVIANDSPKEAFELIWQFLAIASPVMERTSESSASLIEIFHQTCSDASAIAGKANVDVSDLAEKVFKALQINDAGQFDPLIEAMAPLLGEVGLSRLKQHVSAWRDDADDRRHRAAAQAAIQQIADIEGDVDAYIAELSPEVRSSQAVAAQIAQRLLKAGRVVEALNAVEKAEQGKDSEALLDWQNARLDVLEALGRLEDAQADRWAWFEQSLSIEHLRAYLHRLPDFDDVEAEEKAFVIARTFPDVDRALAFFIAWPTLAQGSRMVVDRAQELDGEDYDLFSTAAETLTAKYPVSATILRRAIIDFALENARSSRYKHAARHLMECASVATRLPELDGIESHEIYVSRLRRRHGKKYGFWKRVQL